MQETEIEKQRKLEEKIFLVERELLDKHREWPQAKANWMAKKLLCLI